MARQAPTRIALAPALLPVLALLPALVPAAPAPPGFCVEDRDDALWIDCERGSSGIAGRTLVRCRRAPGAPLIEVPDIARELRAGSGDCPGAAPRGLDKDGIPRTDHRDARAPRGDAHDR